MCNVCIFAKANRKQWKNKKRKNWSKTQTSKVPGYIVSVDQILSHIPGFISQMTGILMKKIYKYTIVYVDQYSVLHYTYLQKSSDADDTIQGKKDFEACCNQNGLRVK